MQTLEQLIGNPDTTVEDIFHASDNVGAIMDAAAVVCADFAQATTAVDAAINAAQEHIERYIERGKVKAGDVLVGEAAVELAETMEQAREAVSAARDAWQRYRPWKEALDCLDQAAVIMQQIESN